MMLEEGCYRLSKKNAQKDYEKGPRADSSLRNSILSTNLVRKTFRYKSTPGHRVMDSDPIEAYER